jgi:biotin transport system substrate-specific component
LGYNGAIPLEVLTLENRSVFEKLMARTMSNVLVDRFSEDRSTAQDLLWVVGFSLLTALLAQIRIPLPYTPVPLTGQTFGALLAGVALGSRRAFTSQLLYLLAGVAGLPVFAGGAFSALYLLGPTGGYLMGLPLAAGVLGWWVERGGARNSLRLGTGLVVSNLLILVAGTSWLQFALRVPFREAWVLGFYPFLLGDILKIALVGLSFPRILGRFEGARHH